MASKTGRRKQSAKKKRVNKTIQNLIGDAIRDPKVRSALYRNPRAAAKRYGLTNEEGAAMQTLKKSLLSGLDRKQVTQLEAIIQMPIAGWGGGPCPPDCTPFIGCPPGGGCPPSCGPITCNPRLGP